MKCILSVDSPVCSWANSAIPVPSPYLLRIANKPWGEYFLDFCFSSSIKQIRILLGDGGQAVEEYFCDGMKWGFELSYGFSREGDGVEEILGKNRDFVAGEDILIVRGPIFIDYSVKADKCAFFNSPGVELLSDDGRGSCLFVAVDSNGRMKGGARRISVEEAGFSLSCILGVKDYYDVSMKVLASSRGNFVLPGYNSEDGVYLGQNVSMHRTARVEKPVMFGNNVEIGSLCVIGPSAVIGTNVIIDNSTVVEASIICDDTYVGRDLEISGKIVSRNRLMDPETGETIILVDKFILSGETMPEILVAMKKFRSMLVAFLLLLAMSPFYFLFMLYFYISGSMVPRPVKFFDSSRKLCCVRAFRWRRGFLSELFFRLCLDKFPMLFEALKGRIFIAGNGIVGVKNTDRTFLDELLVYFPAVFSYWESLASSQGLSDSERRLHDLYYSHRRSLILDVKIVLRFFFRRLIGDYDRGEDIERNGQ